MAAPILYLPNFIENHSTAFNRLWKELEWERRSDAPRREYYCNDVDVPYTYGRGTYARTYYPKPYHEEILAIKAKAEELIVGKLEVCFLNGYENSRDQLGWHADDSPEMDDLRPIVIVTLGARREIMFRDNKTDEVERLFLESGSACVMAKGMQDTHMHRIPKAGFECGPRISLTFRGYVQP